MRTRTLSLPHSLRLERLLNQQNQTLHFRSLEIGEEEKLSHFTDPPLFLREP